MPTRVRILLHEVPPVLRRVLDEAAERHPSIEMVDGLTLQDSASANAHVVLAVTADPHQSATARALLFATQASRVALLTPAGRELVIYDLTSRPVSAVDLPASALLDAVCQGLSDPRAR